MFDAKSRYANLSPYPVADRRGRMVMVVPTPEAPDEVLLGYHRRLQGERLDHLANAYLGDGAGFWRICELADVMLPDALAEAREIPIPPKTRR
ncbi:MAG: hypothetical protein K8W52_42555 [Deltaproteobacteria bacterium]|nr:hypothetical protein [Deltaproteobacteria bacterium]